MARAGYKFFDTDAHVGPYVDVLDPYLSADDKKRLEAVMQMQEETMRDLLKTFSGLRLNVLRTMLSGRVGSSMISPMVSGVCNEVSVAR